MPGLEYTPAPMGRGVLQPSRKSLPTNTCFGEVYSDPLLRVSQKNTCMGRGVLYSKLSYEPLTRVVSMRGAR